MTTWVYRKTPEGVVEVFERGTREIEPSTDASMHPLSGDRHYDGLQATDGADISTRTKHREYMKANGVTVADDFRETWAKSRERQDAYRQGKGGGAVTRNDIVETIARMQSR